MLHMIGLSLAISKWWGFFTGSQLGTVALIRNTGLMKAFKEIRSRFSDLTDDEVQHSRTPNGWILLQTKRNKQHW